jgi:hypothetical protein
LWVVWYFSMISVIMSMHSLYSVWELFVHVGIYAFIRQIFVEAEYEWYSLRKQIK